MEKTEGKKNSKTWPVWGCEQSTFPWTYGQTEQCYILKGKVTVIPDENPEEAVTLEAGDFAENAERLESCTWDVLEDVSKKLQVRLIDDDDVFFEIVFSMFIIMCINNTTFLSNLRANQTRLPRLRKLLILN